MEEAVQEIVKNEKCRFCMDAEFAAKFAPQPSSGHVVHPTLMPYFVPSETMKPGWSLWLVHHGRFQQSPVYSVNMILGGVCKLEGRSVFQLTRLTADSALGVPASGGYVFGSLPDSSDARMDGVPGIRCGEFLVYGDGPGRYTAIVTVPVMHIIAQYHTFG